MTLRFDHCLSCGELFFPSDASRLSPGRSTFTVVLVAQLVSWHSCVADRLPVVARFPAGPRVRFKTVDPPKGNGLGQKKIRQVVQHVRLHVAAMSE